MAKKPCLDIPFHSDDRGLGQSHKTLVGKIRFKLA